MMTPKECILTALRRGTPERIPTFEWFIDTTVLESLAGTDDPIDAAEILDLDAVNVRADYAKKWVDHQTYVDEWGIQKQLTGDVLPASTGHPIADITAQADFTFPRIDAPDRFKTLERALQRYGDHRCVVLNLRDGFSDMRDLLGYQNALMEMLLNKRHFTDLLRRVVEYNLSLAELAVKRYGIEVLATTDDVATATGPIISPKVYAEVIFPYFKEIMQGYRSLGLLTIKHSDGAIMPYLQMWLESGIDCLDPIDPTAKLDMAVMKAEYGHRICLKGNIDCTGSLCDGTPEQVDEEVRICIEKGGPDGLIVSSSNTIHSGVKAENYRAMLNAIKKYGQT